MKGHALHFPVLFFRTGLPLMSTEPSPATMSFCRDKSSYVVGEVEIEDPNHIIKARRKKKMH